MSDRDVISRHVVAAAWMFGAIASFGAMAVAARELSATMHPFQITLLRTVVALFVVLALVARSGWGLTRTRRLRLHLVRNLPHFCAQVGWIYGIALLPLAEVTAIEFTAPIWTAILAIFFLRERMTVARIVAVVLGFGGILVILRPGIEAVHPASLVVLMSAFFFATTHVATKGLSSTEAPLTILFYMMMIQLPLALLPAVLEWSQPTWSDAPWVILVGVSGLTAHYSIARAFLLADATIAIPIDFLRLPLMVVVGLLLYHEAFELPVIVGAVMIFAGNYYNIWRETRRAPLPDPIAPG